MIRWDAPLTPNADQARQWLADELANKVYQDAQPSWLQRALTAVLDWLAGVLDGLGTLGPNVGTVVIIVGAAILIGLAVWLIRPRLRATGANRNRAVFDDDGARRDAAAYRRRADEHARSGRWEQACADRFRALVRAAEEHAVLDPAPGRTAAEAAALLRASYPDCRAPLTGSALLFDAILFGGASAAEQDYAALVSLDKDLATRRPASAGVPNAPARPL